MANELHKTQITVALMQNKETRKADNIDIFINCSISLLTGK